MAAKSKKAKAQRTATEFDLQRLINRLTTQRVSSGAWSWTLGEIQAAREAQMRGDFRTAARLAEAFNTNAALFVAKRNRLAPQRSIPVKLKPANTTARAVRWCDELEALYGNDGVGATPETMVTINRHLADHGVAFGVNTANVRDGGTRIDLEHHVWPISECRWDPTRRNSLGSWGCFVTRVDPETLADASLPLSELADGSYGLAPLPVYTATGEIEIGVPGQPTDGRFTIYYGEELEPWKAGCVLPGALVWAANAFGFRDMNKSSAAHGNVRVMGMLPEGVAIDSDEGAAYLDAILALLEGTSPAGIQPFGAKTEFMTSPSGAYQIFKEIILLSKSDASQIYCGHDGQLGTNSSGPGVDLETLLKISNGIAEGDLHTIERCFKKGVLDVVTALNMGVSDLAPQRLYQIPDADQNVRREAASMQREAFYKEIERERALGFDVTADRIKALAEEHGVTAAELVAQSTEKPSIALAPTDIAKVVSVNEARASAGLGPRLLASGAPDPDGNLTVEEFSAKLKAQAEAAAALMPAATAAPKLPSNGAPRLPAANPS